MICEAHKSHRPEPVYTESHHVIPQAWQRSLGPKLFDPRTVELCRTGHGNVHYWLVAMMKRFSELSKTNTYVIVPDEKVLLKGEKYVRSEAQMAHLALTRWLDAGHALQPLWDAKLWGAI